jgi:hypothetical protein
VVGIRGVAGRLSPDFGVSSESYQGCSGYDGCGVAVIYSVVSCKPERVRRDSVVLYLSVRL